MDKEKSDLEQFLLPVGGFQYHGAPMDNLMATEFTLASLVLDESGSTHSFRGMMEAFVKENVKALRASPRKDNLLYRQLHFGTNLRELHGFKLLEQCNEADYNNCYQDGGSTALYDASVNAIEATVAESKRLNSQQFVSNGIIIWLTDGCDYGSALKQSSVAASLAKAIASEELESILTILIGVNVGGGSNKDKLESFAKEVGIDQFEAVEQITEAAMKKILGFVSKSILSQSKAVGSGGPSKSLTF